jgi:hypothetical protein
MFHVKVVLSTLLGACALFVSAAVAAPVSNDQPSATSAFHTVLQPDLTLKTSLSSSLVPQAADDGKGGFCQCGCGIRCATSADCGGAACRPFITCCARGGEPSNTVAFQFEKSTRTGEVGPLPDTKCK